MTPFEGVAAFAVLLAVAAVVLAAIACGRGGRGRTGRRGARGARGATGPPAGDDDPPMTMEYYLSIEDFALSFVEIPTSNVSPSGTTIASSYLAGRAPLYNARDDINVGTCSASFLNMQTSEGIFTDISNYIATVDGLIVTWFTPTTLINLELDSIIHGMVTEAIVTVTTKVGASPFFGKTYDLVVSSDGQYIHFKFTAPASL